MKGVKCLNKKKVTGSACMLFTHVGSLTCLTGSQVLKYQFRLVCSKLSHVSELQLKTARHVSNSMETTLNLTSIKSKFLSPWRVTKVDSTEMKIVCIVGMALI